MDNISDKVVTPLPFRVRLALLTKELIDKKEEKFVDAIAHLNTALYKLDQIAGNKTELPKI
jgi:hypothetical protein